MVKKSKLLFTLNGYQRDTYYCTFYNNGPPVCQRGSYRPTGAFKCRLKSNVGWLPTFYCAQIRRRCFTSSRVLAIIISVRRSLVRQEQWTLSSLASRAHGGAHTRSAAAGEKDERFHNRHTRCTPTWSAHTHTSSCRFAIFSPVTDLDF